MANKVVCLDTEVRPIKGKCFVYSFGVKLSTTNGHSRTSLTNMVVIHIQPVRELIADYH